MMKKEKTHHRDSNLYCPYCFTQMIEVIKTGFTFCRKCICEYEVTGTSKPPIKEEDVALCREKGDIQIFIDAIKSLIPYCKEDSPDPKVIAGELGEALSRYYGIYLDECLDD